jgi:hypothetical protein
MHRIPAFGFQHGHPARRQIHINDDLDHDASETSISSARQAA